MLKTFSEAGSLKHIGKIFFRNLQYIVTFEADFFERIIAIGLGEFRNLAREKNFLVTLVFP